MPFVRFDLVLLRWRIKFRHAEPLQAFRQWLASVSLLVEWGLPLGLGIAMAQWDEFGPALCLFVIAACVLILRCSFWKGTAERRKTTLVFKGFGVAGSVMFFLMCWLVTWTKKGDKPWSPTWNQYFLVASAPKSAASHYLVPIMGYEKTLHAYGRPEDHTEVALQFAGREELQLLQVDTTTVTAAKPKYWFAMIDATNCFTWVGKPDDCEPLPLQTRTYDDDYINGEARSGPYEVLWQSPSQIAKQHVKSNDVIVGIVGSTCFNCVKARLYYVYFKFNEGGWFYPVPAKSNLLVPTAKLSTIPDLLLEQFLDKQIPKEKRIPIPAQFDFKQSAMKEP